MCFDRRTDSDCGELGPSEKCGDQASRPDRQEHEDDRRVDYWSSLKPEETWAYPASIRHCDEKKHASDRERDRANYNVATHASLSLRTSTCTITPMIYSIAIIAAVIWFGLNGLLWFAKPGDLLWLLGSGILGALFFAGFFWYLMLSEVHHDRNSK